MRKFFYNEKIRKLILSAILVVLCFNFIPQYVVLAETQVVGTEITNSNINTGAKMLSQAIMQNSDYYGEDEENLIEDKYRFSETSAAGCIRRIFNASSHNKISYTTKTVTYENGYKLDFVTIYIYTNDIETIVKCFNDSSFNYIISNSRDYPYIQINEVKVETNPDIELEEGETVEYGLQQLNKEQYKIAIWLENKYASKGLTQPVIAYWVANNYWDADYTTGQYITKVERDSKGNITNVELDLATIQVSGLDVSTEAFEAIVEEQEEESADLGGILLSPVFSLVNFVADAIVSGLGTVMMGEGSGFVGLGVLSIKKDENVYTNTTSREVSTKSFLGKGIFKYQYPHISYTPEQIFAGQVPLLSIDFISGKYYDKNTGATANELNKGWTSIRKVISQWYQVLRMIAIIGFLSVLIYTGIKIIISSNAKDKAKYKEWIINWLVGIAILFFMHYIMAFIISINGEFSNLISSSFTGIHVTPSDNSENAFDTNLMGLVRFMVQSQNFYIKVGYEIMYIALIVYTIKFTFIYLKRVLNMAFLTLIAPIVALTYPIDKMNDGKAQGFDMWLKEYIFNALLQPMHCILYYVLVGTAIDVAVSNPIYAVVVLAFMTEAEKIFKKIFGFDKANPGTVGGMSSAFAAGTIASGIVKDVAKFSKGNKGKGGNAGGNTQNNPLDNVKPLESGSIEDNFKDNLLDGGDSPSGNTTGGTQGGGNSSNGNTTGGTPTRGSSTSRNNSTNKDSSTDSKEPATGKGPSVKNGLKNVGKKLINPIYAIGRGKEYNKKRWLRRLGKGAKGVGKLAIGTAAAAVQAGISITDGKYSLKEGVASFAAGYVGGEKILNGIGKPISSVVGAYREGYHEGDEEYLRERQKQQFMDNDEIYKMYKNKYGSKAETMQRLAADNMVPYGYTDVKEQFKIQKMANEIIKKNKQYDSYNDSQKQEYMEKALKQARNTKSFIDSPGVNGIVHSPGKQEDYIKAEIKSRGITDENSQEAQAIRTGLQNAFNSAALWQQVNK